MKHITDSMTKEIGFVVVGFADTLQEANEIAGIVELAKLGIQIQNLNRKV